MQAKYRTRLPHRVKSEVEGRRGEHVPTCTHHHSSSNNNVHTRLEEIKRDQYRHCLSLTTTYLPSYCHSISLFRGAFPRTDVYVHLSWKVEGQEFCVVFAGLTCMSECQSARLTLRFV
mmetsp:Transcript_35051/g.90921  ORF Transcript_35051/g.90921 Transcript_35051/m.90921 type:complete len:118 (-) Transcript_35051:155-508(-)